jgi:hypothetical protein
MDFIKLCEEHVVPTVVLRWWKPKPLPLWRQVIDHQSSVVRHVIDNIRDVQVRAVEHVSDKLEGCLIKVGLLPEPESRGWVLFARIRDTLSDARVCAWRTPRWVYLGVGIVAGFVLVRSVVLRSKEVPWVRDLVWSRLVEFFRRPLNPKVRTDIQRHLAWATVGVRDGHPHKEAASNRNGGTAALYNAASSLGMPTYTVSGSERELDEKGCRYYYQLNDFKQQVKVTRLEVMIWLL